MHLNNPFHTEISRHFPHRDKYFLSLWAGEKINCKKWLPAGDSVDEW